MKKIFISEPLQQNILIPKEEAHHLLNVLRHPWEKPVTISDSHGQTGIYTLDKQLEEGVAATLMEWVESGTQPQTELVLVQAFLKGEKFEYVLQKATELGVDTVYGVPTTHCVAQYKGDKLAKKEERWQKIMKEAAQQCGRTKLPRLYMAKDLDEVCRQEADSLLLVAYEAEQEHSLKQALQAGNHHRVAVIIGPEGGLGEAEVGAVEVKGARRVSLGNTILRAETAAVAALAMIHYECNL